MGLDVYLTKDGFEVELPSTKYPDHMFKIGYFRSSYNDGGINHVLRSMGLDDLYDIFQGGGDGKLVVDWSNCLSKVDKLIADCKKYLKSDAAKYTAIVVSKYKASESEVSTEAQAIGLFLNVAKDHQKTDENSPFDMSSFSSRNGDFFLKGLDVRAVIPMSNGILGQSHERICLIVPTKKGWFDWYMQALEIVRETVRYVLTQPDPSEYKLIWSG